MRVMYRKVFILISSILVLALAGSASAITWTDGGSDHLWSNVENWAGEEVPGAGNNQVANIDYVPGGTGPTIQTGDNFTPWDVDVGNQPGEVTMTMTGGTLSGSGHFGFAVNPGSNCTLNMSSGLISFPETINIGGSEGGSVDGVAVVNMDGGTIYQSSGNFKITGTPGTINLNAGLIDVYNFDMGEEGSLDIEAGALIIDGNEVSYINNLVDSGRIYAYGGNGTVNIEYAGGKTTVTAAPPGGHCKAYNPSPSNGKTDVRVKPVLSWSVGGYVRDVNGHAVYFGKTNPPPFVKYRSEPNCAAGTLEFDTSYYWRIDEVNEAEPCSPWEGQVWSFTTKSVPVHFLAGDLNGDCFVNWRDLELFTACWLDADCFSPYCKADLDGIDGVDVFDFALLAENWVAGTSLVDDEEVGFIVGGER